MPVYNTSVEILKEAVDSILNQTFSCFEFLIIDDASAGSTEQYLNSINDSRVRIIRNPANLGVTKSLNVGFKAAQGKYIARMDADDISVSTRFEKQYAFMESHPDAIVCGTSIRLFGSAEAIVRYDFSNQELYRAKLFLFNAGPSHPTAFFSRDKLLSHHLLYDERLQYAQDYEMWCRAIECGKIYCLDEVLLLYRMHEAQISQKHNNAQNQCARLVIINLLKHFFTHCADDTISRHLEFVSNPYLTKESEEWCHILINENNKNHCYDKKCFNQVVYKKVSDKLCETYQLKKNNPFRFMIFYKYIPIYYATLFIMERIKKNLKN